MIKFDNTHKSIDGNIDKRKGKQTFKKLVAIGMAIYGLVLFSGCTKNNDCKIDRLHAHRYVDKNTNLSRYIISEKRSESWMGKRDEYVLIDENDKETVKKLDFANRKELYKINENLDAIQEMIKDNKYHYEYEYKYYPEVPVTKYVYIDGSSHIVTYYEKSKTPVYEWTTDSNHSGLTGKMKLVYPAYQGIKIVSDGNGGYKEESSPVYYDFDSIPEEYEYVRSGICRFMAMYDQKDIAEYLAYINELNDKYESKTR